jgi:hypothetical protein
MRRVVVQAAAIAAMLLLAACNDTHPLFGPNTPRDGAGRPVDPVYGIPLPGTSLGNGGG